MHKGSPQANVSYPKHKFNASRIDANFGVFVKIPLSEFKSNFHEIF